jgi:hypothetical protein
VLTFSEERALVFTLLPGALTSAAPSPALAPHETALFVDVGSRHVVAARWWGERVSMVALGRASRWPDWGGPLTARIPRDSIPSLRDTFACVPYESVSKAEALAVYGQLVGVPRDELDRHVMRLVEIEPDGDGLVAFGGALERLGAPWTLGRQGL